MNLPFTLVVAALLGAILYATCYGVYNVFFHPLRGFPGPKLWSMTFLVRHVYNIRGQLDWSIKALHEKYGPVVRYSPEEVSFSSEQAWRDIYARRDLLVKDPLFYNAVSQGPNGAKSIFNAEPEHHPAIRKQLSHAFSERALRDQEPMMRAYIDLLIAKLRGIAAAGDRADMTSWFKFTTFDMIGDLAIGQPFNCLRDGRYHTWVASLYQSIKIGPYMRAVATYTDVKRLMLMLAPASVREARARHERYVKEKALARMGLGVMEERKDFLSYILRNQSKSNGLTQDEVVANCSFLILAGSDATASALSGIIYHLLRNPERLQRVVQEIRACFKTEDDISFATTATRLTYTLAAVNEGFRLYPPGPTLAPRRTPRGGMTNIDGYMVPPWQDFHSQTVVGVHALAATRSSLNWHRAEEFIPERWLPEHIDNPESPFYADKRGASQPFGIGPRNCLAQSLALNELRSILARILWNFDMTLCPESERWTDQVTYTLWEKPPLWVRLKERDPVGPVVI